MKSTFYNNWKKSFNKRKFLIKIYFTIPVLVLGLIYFTRFLTFIEYRPGIVLPDPLLDSFEPINLTWFIFAFTYGSVLFGVLTIVSKPKLVLTVLHAYMLILVFRVICLYFTPLEPPSGIIPLHDIMIEDSFYSGRMNLKDLFFSGHTAAIMLFFFAAESKRIKIIMIFLTLIVISGLLIQHVHYTIDVIAAPFFSWVSFKIAKRIN